MKIKNDIMRDLKMGLEYDTNKEYLALRSLSDIEMLEDSLAQKCAIVSYWIDENMFGRRKSLDRAAFEWINKKGPEWRNYRNYERFYKKRS